MMHHNGCPSEDGGDCRCVDAEWFLQKDFVAEDVQHIDDVIMMAKGSATAMPGIEWVRNMVAARVGAPLRPLGVYRG